MAPAPPARSTPPTDPCPEIPEWARDTPDAGLFDHDRTDDGEIAEGDANDQDENEVQGEGDSDEDHRDDELCDERVEVQDDENDDQGEDDDEQGNQLDDDDLGDENVDADDGDELRVVPLPRLTEDLVQDQDELDLVLAEVVGVSSVAREMQDKIDFMYDELAARLAPVDFAVVMQAVQMAQARLGVLLPLIAGWAWSEGLAQGQGET